MTSSYKKDLAYIHDVGFGDFARQAAVLLKQTLRNRGVTEGRVVDLGCGTGLLAKELLDADYAVLGVDISEAMIAIARKRAPKAEFVQASFHEIDMPQCVAVTSIGECLNYLFDRKNRKRALARLFQRIYDALEHSGFLLFDVIEPGYASQVTRQRRFLEGDGWATLVEMQEDGRRQELNRVITCFRQVGKLYRRDHEVHLLQLHRRSEIARELRRVGFRVRFLRGYGKLLFGKAHAGFLARKA